MNAKGTLNANLKALRRSLATAMPAPAASAAAQAVPAANVAAQAAPAGSGAKAGGA